MVLQRFRAGKDFFTNFSVAVLCLLVTTFVDKCRLHGSQFLSSLAGFDGVARKVYADNPLEITHPPEIPPGENLVKCVPSRFPLLLSTLSGATFLFQCFVCT